MESEKGGVQITAETHVITHKSAGCFKAPARPKYLCAVSRTVHPHAQIDGKLKAKEE